MSNLNLVLGMEKTKLNKADDYKFDNIFVNLFRHLCKNTDQSAGAVENTNNFSVLVWFGLVCWVLWHINLFWLFNAKSIFM